MNFLDFYNFLKRHEEANQHGVYAVWEFVDILPREKIEFYLSQAQKLGVVDKIVDEIWHIHHSSLYYQDMIARLIYLLRPEQLNYVSLESALAQHKLIDDLPFVLTVNTTGQSGSYYTKLITIEFVHTNYSRRALEEELMTLDNGLLIAPANLAYSELKKLSRNLHLVKEKELVSLK